MSNIVRAVAKNLMTSAKPLSNYPVKRCGEYLIRHATPEELMSITKLRAEHLWNHPIREPNDIKQLHEELVEQSNERNFHCIVAVNNKADPIIKDSILGALTLKVEINVPQLYEFAITDTKWMSNEEKDAYVCDVVVTPREQGRQIGTNLLLYAKEVAEMRNMERFMAYTDKEHVIKMNKKVGLQVVESVCEEGGDTVMGLHLPKVPYHDKDVMEKKTAS